ncbi:TPA: AAA family ATPase [Klebsiella aerogenes]|nr:AAA family ATPase [Klebsiella aerogenes]HBW5536576.1 AAA family ATPase [Klebsiella aerogenes]HCS4221496.1 AAA family ATPase [Klebsiella aerogenes]
MLIESVKLTNFRSFGPDGQKITLDHMLTTLIGANGTGKTAVLQALQRLFGVTSEQRIISRQDFHIPTSEIHAPDIRTLSLEAIIAFPELDDDQGDHSAIPEFFRSMSIADENGRLKCRLRLDAQWDDDGTIDGYVTSQFHAITCWDNDEPDDSDFHKVRPSDRAKIQLIYIPAIRSATAQVSSFLKGRLWKAINWSSQVRASFAEKAHELNSAFEGESAIDAITGKLTQRWQQLHSAGTDSTPKFRPVDVRFEEFVRKVDVLLHPDESGRDRSVEELSDGQSSLFHIAMTSATLDVEREIRLDSRRSAFLYDDLPLPSLTLLALEEPENNLSPHYLSRIVSQLNELTGNIHAQAIISSHSSSILARIDPTQIRHFRLDVTSKNTIVKALTLPKEDNDAAKYIQQAVRAWPELYFAKVVVLGEGASEEILLPAVAGAMGIPIDRSFVAMVPLGGRHVNHMWRLLYDLQIPFITLLDLDWGRHGGGWGRIKNIIAQMINFGIAPQNIFKEVNPSGYEQNLLAFDTFPHDNRTHIDSWVDFLRRFNIFFSSPLDIDYSMLKAFSGYYQVPPEENASGPSLIGDPRDAVLGSEGIHALYADDFHVLRWYRYLFLGRGKPSTHIRVLSQIPSDQLAQNAPDELKALVQTLQHHLENQGSQQ